MRRAELGTAPCQLVLCARPAALPTRACDARTRGRRATRGPQHSFDGGTARAAPERSDGTNAVGTRVVTEWPVTLEHAGFFCCTWCSWNARTWHAGAPRSRPSRAVAGRAWRVGRLRREGSGCADRRPCGPPATRVSPRQDAHGKVSPEFIASPRRRRHGGSVPARGGRRWRVGRPPERSPAKQPRSLEPLGVVLPEGPERRGHGPSQHLWPPCLLGWPAAGQLVNAWVRAQRREAAHAARTRC